MPGSQNEGQRVPQKKNQQKQKKANVAHVM